MILIISDNDDESTNDVIDWISFKSKNFVRINRTDVYELHKLELSNEKKEFELNSIGGKSNLKLSIISSYWYRRGYINIKFTNLFDILKEAKPTDPFYFNLHRYLSTENHVVLSCIYNMIYRLKGFGKFHENETNKLENLMIAKSVGLNIPSTVISSKKNILMDFHKSNNGKVITKTINQSGGITWENYGLYGLTGLVTLNSIKRSFTHWASKLQNKIDKKYEIRLFYLNEKIFASAIFSQSNKKTLIDFRNYDSEIPNRVVPYKLPKTIERKIIAFMFAINMKSGSIDMIVDDNNEFIFLEVNPIGQFAQVSAPCNYYIEEYICDYLT